MIDARYSTIRMCHVSYRAAPTRSVLPSPFTQRHPRLPNAAIRMRCWPMRTAVGFAGHRGHADATVTRNSILDAVSCTQFVVHSGVSTSPSPPCHRASLPACLRHHPAIYAHGTHRSHARLPACCSPSRLLPPPSSSSSSSSSSSVHHGAYIQHLPQLIAHLRLQELQDPLLQPRRHPQPRQPALPCPALPSRPHAPTLTAAARTSAASMARPISSTTSSTSPSPTPTSAT